MHSDEPPSNLPKLKKKRQLAFYAEPDVDTFLETVGSAQKSKTINDALRAYMNGLSEPSPSKQEMQALVNQLQDAVKNIQYLANSPNKQEFMRRNAIGAEALNQERLDADAAEKDADEDTEAEWRASKID
jgi:hypothetical protein